MSNSHGRWLLVGAMAFSLAIAGSVVPGVWEWLRTVHESAVAPLIRGAVASSLRDGTDPHILAAGDIASCISTGDEATKLLLDANPGGTVLTLGDNVYDNGTTTEFNNCYDPTWGVHKTRTSPSSGNHEYSTPGAAGYYGYFGAAAGDPTKGYYSFDVRSWHLIALNSNCSIVACAAGSAQEQWLRADLAASPSQCVLAYWHHPRFSSGSSHGNSTSVQPLWQALYDFNADVVLSGHEHNYERFAPQTPQGAADPVRGIREFVAGTGGRSHYGFGAIKPNSEVRDSTTWGVLKLTLHETTYDWQFLNVSLPGQTFTDNGSASCSIDSELDGWIDPLDNCPSDVNPAQTNSDAAPLDGEAAANSGTVAAGADATNPHADGLGDACDPDDDNDGLADAAEAAGCNGSPALSMTDFDSDDDLFPDGYECAHATNPALASGRPSYPPTGGTDSDGDGLLDAVETLILTLGAGAADFDGDGCSDAKENASVNGDLLVSSADLSAVAQRFGGYRNVTSGAIVYAKQIYDFNRDGTIGSADLSAVAQRFGGC